MKAVNNLTTDEVREAFATMEDESATEANHVAFDLWLVTERQRVADLAKDRERERIIKLLEENHKRGIADSTCGVCKFLDSSVALIKGE